MATVVVPTSITFATANAEKTKKTSQFSPPNFDSTVHCVPAIQVWSSLIRFLLFVAYRSYHACKTAAWPESVLLKCGCAPNLVASPSSWQTHANCKLQFGSQVVWNCHLHPLAAWYHWYLFTIWRHEDVQYVPSTRTLQHASFVARGCACPKPFPTTFYHSSCSRYWSDLAKTDQDNQDSLDNIEGTWVLKQQIFTLLNFRLF